MKRLITLLGILIITQLSFGQLSGTYNIPGDYATIAEAVTDLNVQGVIGGGGVTFYVAAGHSETTTAPITINPSVIGSAADPILFQKLGDGSNPLVTRTDAGSLSTSSIGASGDAVIRIEGTDYITFDGINVASDLQGIEYGYLTHKPSGTDGCQFVTIKNCTIDMTKGTSGYIMGIYISNGPTSTTSATTGAVTVSSSSGTNSYITIAGNTIQDVHVGVYVRGYSSATYYDNNIVIGQSGAGNTIQNFGGGNISTTYGVYFIYVSNPTVEYNIINNAGGGGSAHNSTLYGIFYSTVNGIVNGNNNQFTLSNSSASSATQYIYNGNLVTSNNFNNNTFAAGTISSTGTVYLIYASSGTLSNTISGNQTSGTINRTGASGTFYCFYNNGSPGSGSENIYNNNFSNITLAGSSTFYCINSTTAAGHTQNVYDNTISNITLGTGTFYGMNLSAANTRNVYNNSVYNVTSSGTIYGLSLGSGANPGKIYNNEVHDLTSSSTTATLYGIYCTSGTAVSLYNNYIYRLYAPLSGNTTTLAGIYISGGTNFYISYNTVYLDAASSGANFGSSAIYTSSTPTVEFKNNAFINMSAPAGTGLTVAYRRSTTTLTTYSAASDYNDFYAGAPSANHLIFYDGTTPQQTIAEFKTLVTPRDANSFSENPPFVEVITAPYNLHMRTDIATQCEGGGSTVTGITDDFDGDTRLDPPDVGADEFEGIPAAVCEGIPAASTITGEQELCFNTGTLLSLSTLYTDLGITFQWASSETAGGPYTAVGANSPSLNTGNLTVDTYFICTITCELSAESYVTNEFGISINPLPNVTVIPTSGTYCTPGGTPVTLTASGATTYSWNPADGLDNTTSSVVNASPASTTTYTVTGMDDNGCENTATVTITVLSYPVISSVSADPATICSGNTTQLAVSVVPTQANTYSFSASSGTFTPLSGGTVVTDLQADDTFSGLIPIGFTFNYSGSSYSEVYSNSNGYLSFNPNAPTTTATNARTNNLASNPAAATLQPLIAPLWDDLDGRATGGSTPSYITTGTPGNQVFTFEWLNWEWNWQSVDAVISFQVKLYESDGHIEFIYREDPDVISSGSASIGIAGTTAGNFISLNGTGISPTASTIVSTNTLNTKPATGQVYTFTPPQFEYSWTPAAGLTPNANVANPVTPPLTEETTYTVTVSNGTCSVNEDITVFLPSPLVASVTSPLRCTGDVTTAITGSQTGGAPEFTYTWSPVTDLYVDAEGLDDYDGAALNSPVIYTKTSVTGFSYLLTVTDNCGTIATATSTVTVYQTPTASASSNGPVCTGETLELYGTTDIGTSFSWTGPNSFTSDLQNPTIPDVSMAANGTYYFTATANGCPSAVASVEVDVNQTPSALSITPSDALICPGSVQELTAIGGTISNQIILTENFNGAVPGWTTLNNSTGGTPANAAWSLYLSGASVASNDNSVFVLSNSDAQGSGSTTDTRLFTPVMNTNGLTSITLNFWHNFRWYSILDTARIEVSIDGGLTWLVAPLVQYVNTSVGSPLSWANAVIDMSAYINQPNLMLCFHYKAVWGYWWGIDNLVISGDGDVQITWAPYDNLYLDAGAVTPYAGENTSTVFAEIYTTETYTATATSTDGCSVTATATVTGVTYDVSGTLKYNNSAQTPMNLVTLTLNPGGYTAVTDGGGNYLFEDICAGDYTIAVTNINKPVGGINSTDAVQMNKWNSTPVPIEHVKFLAGETSFDDAVTATDALAVQNYFVFGTPFIRTTITGSPWVFWKAADLIMDNFDPNRLLTSIPVTVSGNTTVALYGQSIGDFGGSFTPGLLKNSSESVTLIYNETKLARGGVEFELPVRMMNASSVSAVSLILNFPSDLVKVTGVSMNENEVQPAWSVNGNELKIGWNSLQPLWTGAGDDLLTIRVITSESFSQGEAIRFELAADPLNELADGNSIVIPDAVIGMDAVEFSVYGIGEPSTGSGLTLQTRPNPFADYTILNFTVPADGHVTLQVSDMLGRKVSVPVDEFRSAGTYSVKLDAVPLQPGVYTATITLQNALGDMVRTIKLVRR